MTTDLKWNFRLFGDTFHLLFDFLKFPLSITFTENSSETVTLGIYAKTNLTDQFNQRPI